MPGLGFSRTEDSNFPFEKKLERLSLGTKDPSQTQLWFFLPTGIPLWNKQALKKLMANMRGPCADRYRCDVCANEFSFRRSPVLCPSCNAVDSFVFADSLVPVENKKEIKVA